MVGTIKVISLAEYYGGCVEYSGSIAEDAPRNRKIIVMSPSSLGSLDLPDATRLEKGHSFILVNLSASRSVTIARNNRTLLHTLTGLTCVTVSLIQNTTVGGTWVVGSVKTFELQTA